MKWRFKVLLPVLLLWALPAAVRAQFTFSTNNGAITITGYTGPGGNATIPSTTNGLPVTRIGDWACYQCSTLTGVIIPSSVTYIGYRAFDNCASLAGLYFLGNAPSVNVVLGSSSNMTIYYLPGTTGWDDFAAQTGLPTGVWNSDVPCTYSTNNGSITIAKYVGSGGAVTIPNTINGLPVTTMGTNAFASSYGVTSVAIPDSMISIGDEAFKDSTGLSSVTIPGGVTSIGSHAFQGCASLTAINVSPLNNVYRSVAGVLFNNGQTTLIQYPGGKAGSYAIPNGVISIADEAFAYSPNLTSVTIPNNVTNMADGAFSFCSGLTNVTIGSGVASIGTSAFSGCYSLTSLTIGSSVASIGAGAFSDCNGLTSLTIPNSVTNIGSSAFSNCGGLTSAAIGNGVTSIGYDAFSSCSSLANVTIGNSVTYLGDFAFAWCYSLTNVTIPGRITSIGAYAFAGCYGLTNVVLTAGITGIGSFTFYDCTGLTTVAIPNSVSSIGDGAFSSCTSLLSVSVGNGASTIGNDAFSYCTSLTNITIGNSAARILDRAFYMCTNLTLVFFQGNAPSVAPSVFAYDSNATVYYFPGTTGWDQWVGPPPAVLWNPQVQTGGGTFGVVANAFGFTIVGTVNIPIVIEASTNLAHPVWLPLQSCTLTNGSLHFSDPQWTNYPARLYRLRWP